MGIGRNTFQYRSRSNAELNESLLESGDIEFVDIVSDISSEDTFYLSSEDGPDM